MSFLLDTDICSAYLKNHPAVISKVMSHFGGLHVSAITVAELLTWALRGNAPPRRLPLVRSFLSACCVHEIDAAIAEKFAELRAQLLAQGITAPELDLFNDAAALVHNHTMVTHNTSDYAMIPGLTFDDWMIP